MLRPFTGSIVIEADERGAVVKVDGKPSGFTPAVIQGVAVGRRRVRVELRGYTPVEIEVDVHPDRSAQPDPNQARAAPRGHRGLPVQGEHRRRAELGHHPLGRRESPRSGIPPSPRRSRACGASPSRTTAPTRRPASGAWASPTTTATACSCSRTAIRSTTTSPTARPSAPTPASTSTTSTASRSCAARGRSSTGRARSPASSTWSRARATRTIRCTSASGCTTTPPSTGAWGSTTTSRRTSAGVWASVSAAHSDGYDLACPASSSRTADRG